MEVLFLIACVIALVLAVFSAFGGTTVVVNYVADNTIAAVNKAFENLAVKLKKLRHG